MLGKAGISPLIHPAHPILPYLYGQTVHLEGQREYPIQRFRRGEAMHTLQDHAAVEEPLEIRLEFGPSGHRQERTLAITMRTPGQDEELVRGFLLAERLVTDPTQILSIEPAPVRRAEGQGHTMLARLDETVAVDWSQLERHVYLTSSCGVCGKASIASVLEKVSVSFYPMSPVMEAETIQALPARLRSAQRLFAATGGIHACGLFDDRGALLAVREDVGRHNAADKICGALAVHPEWQQRAAVAVLSGRASFELVQKMLVAGIPILVAVGAPSSLAIDLAAEAGMTLIGFAGEDRFNLYGGGQRIRS